MTIKLGLIGHPVSHSISPVLHIAALRYCGLSGDYLLIDTLTEDVSETLERLAAEGFLGINVTVPHKQAVIPHMASLTEAAQRCGAVNTIRFDSSGAYGHNTDMQGFLHALQHHHMQECVAAGNICVAGAGGAARAALWALNSLHPQKIHLVARRAEAFDELILDLRRNAEWLTPLEFVGTDDAAAESLREQIDLLVNCTSVGVTESYAALPQWASSLVTSALRPGAPIFDMVYKKSLFGAVAREHDHPFADGLEMLLGQAALAFEFWTKQSVPVQIMRDVL